MVDDCGAGTDTTCTWTNLGTPVNGQIETGGDSDWYKITPAASGTWRFQSSLPVGGLPDPYGLLHAADGTVLAYNDDGAGNRQFLISYDLVAGTTYYLEVKGWSSWATGAYTVTAYEPLVMILSPTAWAAPAAGGTTVIQVTTNSSWGLALPGWMEADTYSGSGNAVVTLTAKPNTTGTARNEPAVFVMTAQQVFGKEVPVSVSQAAQPAATDCGSTRENACQWTNLATPVSGVLDTQPDSDWYQITPATTGSWTFTSSIPATGGARDTVGILYDRNGTYITSDDDHGGNFQFSMTVPLVAGTTYYLLVVPLPDYSQDNRGTYTVTATVR